MTKNWKSPQPEIWTACRMNFSHLPMSWARSEGWERWIIRYTHIHQIWPTLTTKACPGTAPFLSTHSHAPPQPPPLSQRECFFPLWLIWGPMLSVTCSIHSITNIGMSYTRKIKMSKKNKNKEAWERFESEFSSPWLGVGLLTPTFGAPLPVVGRLLSARRGNFAILPCPILDRPS